MASALQLMGGGKIWMATTITCVYMFYDTPSLRIFTLTHGNLSTSIMTHYEPNYVWFL